jgi:hypothetical protein
MSNIALSDTKSGWSLLERYRQPWLPLPVSPYIGGKDESAE